MARGGSADMGGVVLVRFAAMNATTARTKMARQSSGAWVNLACLPVAP